MQAPADATADASRDTIRTRSAQIVLIEDSQGVGTGVFVGADGFILTNKHVAPSLGPYRVILADGKDVRGVGVHQSPHHDLAIVKVALSVSSYLDVGADVADAYIVGEEVFALGHPRGCRFSVARGIISNPHREFEKEYYVQTDVSINPGNSGGPLVDGSGKLVGIVTMILSGSQGLGFAVPGHVAGDYVRHVRRLLRANVVRIPEDLLRSPEPSSESATEVVRKAVGALVFAGRCAIEEEKADEGQYKLKHKGAAVTVSVREGLFSARAQVTALGPGERQNAPFLARLLELSASKDLGGASFIIDDNVLYASVSRRASGLSVEEAAWAIDLLAHLAVEAPQKIAVLLFSTARTPEGLPAPAPMPPGGLAQGAPGGLFNAPGGLFNGPAQPFNPPPAGPAPYNAPPQPYGAPGAASPAPYNYPAPPYNAPAPPYNAPGPPYNAPASPFNAPAPPFNAPAANPAPPNAPPPAAPGPPADPGYPILQMPPITGWK